MDVVQGSGGELFVSMPFLSIGCITGIISFAILMLVLLPVLHHKRQASMLKGFLAIVVSFALLSLGLLVCLLVARAALLVFLVGELLGFFAGWIALAVYVMVKR